VIRGLKAMYRGDNHFNLVGRSRLFLTISILAMVFSAGSLVTRRLNLGIEFEGGSLWVVPVTADVSEGDVAAAAGRGGLADQAVQFVNEQGTRKARVTSRSSDPALVDHVNAELASLPGASADTIEVTSVGPTWGSQISRKALQALIIFLILVTIYISLRFEWKMALAALACLIHDLLITGGVYSLVGFEVVPATVIATLTILGYSLYDTVVVFDKVQENTSLAAQTARQSYSDTANDSLNQVLMRSLNTSLVVLIPVGALLFVGITRTGTSVLKDFGLALFVGILSGTYSSIFFATPLLALLKEREPRYQQIRARLVSRAGREPLPRRPVVKVDEAATDQGEAAEEEVAAEPVKAPAKAGGKGPARRPARGGSRPRPSGGKKRSGGKRRR